MILLLGGHGYIGSAFADCLTQRGLDYRIVSRADGVDYHHPKVMEGLIRQTSADFVINAAGYTGKPNVDACEWHRSECLLGNAVLPGQIDAACRTIGIPWGHVSSGCIYTGCRADGSGFTEEDAPNFSFRQNNCSFYSGCKALGEEILLDASSVYIWRPRIPFNHQDGPRNYLSKLMRYQRLLDAANSISHLGDFVAACLDSWQHQLPYGIYNVTNPGHITTRRVVELIQQSGICDQSFDFFESESEFMKVAASTPRSNCILSSEKLLAGGVKMRNVDDAIADSLRQWQPERMLENVTRSGG